jgi:hypothetical protein
MAEFEITNSFVTVNGIEATPKIGDAFSVGIDYVVHGTPSAPYKIRFTVAGLVLEMTVNDLTSGTKPAVKDYWPLPLDGEIPWKVQIDPDHVTSSPNSGSPAKTGSFEPIPPHTAIEYYDPVYVHGLQQWGIDVTGHIGNVKAMLGRPATGVWQKVLSQSSFAYRYIAQSDGAYRINPMIEKKVDNAGKYEVYFWNKSEDPRLKSITIGMEFDMELENVRVNADKLRNVTWHDLQAVSDPVQHHYQQPEDIVQSDSPKISAFVKNHLGDDFKTTMTPYDAARKIFCAVVKHTSYYYPAPGEPDERPADAVGMLEKGKGDCGGFSILLVAVFRNIGFPARTSCGYWIGPIAHCWCELFFPGHGWIVADGSGGDGSSKDGKFAFCFGNQTDMNRRLAVMRGNTFNIGDFEIDWLQGPFGPFADGDDTPTPAAGFSQGVYTVVDEVQQTFVTTRKEITHEPSDKPPVVEIPEAMRVRTPQAELQRVASERCPCAQHGGFRPLPSKLRKVGTNR